MTAIPQMLTVHIPPTVRRRGGRKVVIAPDGTEAPAVGTAARIDSTLVKALARAFRWRRMLESGVVSTVGEIAAREKINKSYVSRVLRLTLLAPEIVEAILDGRQPTGWSLPALLKPPPCRWDQQRDELPALLVVMPFTDAVAPRDAPDPPWDSGPIDPPGLHDAPWR
jgi:hypothetical protein